MEFEAKLQEKDAQNKELMEALRALKYKDEVESPDLKGKGKELAVQQDEKGWDNHANDLPPNNLVVDLNKQQQEHNPDRQRHHILSEVYAKQEDRRRAHKDEEASSSRGVKRNRIAKED